MKKKLLQTKSSKYLILISSFLLFGAIPYFAGSGLDNAEPLNSYLNYNFPPRLSSGLPYVPVFSNLTFDSPLTFNEVPNANKIIVGQRDGQIFWFDKIPDVSSKNLLLDLSDKVGVVWDGGFLGLALHPEFGNPGHNYFYVFYTTEDANSTDYPNYYTTQSCHNEEYWGNFLVLARYEMDPITLNVQETSEQVLIKLRMYGTTHRGGGLLFGDDGFLYLTTGDQTAFKKAQDINNNLDGGVLRLDVDEDNTRSHPPVRTMPEDHGFSDEITGNGYWIPNDNPFLSPTGENFEEYYSIGHRNPHRMTKDRSTGELYVGEIGGGRHEEINVIKKGKNYGWPIYEGLYMSTSCLTGLLNGMAHEEPLTIFPRSAANAVIGGYVYRGSEIPELQGKYVCADYGVGEEIWTIDISTGNYSQLGSFSSTDIISFGEDEDAELYIMKLGVSTLYKMVSKDNPFETVPQFLSETGAFTDLNTLEPTDGLIPYDLVESFWSDGALKKRWVGIPNDGSHDTAGEKINYSEDDIWNFPVGSVLVKHFELPIDESNPSITKRLETRFSIKAEDGNFYFATYKWNAQQTDAELLLTGLDETINITKIGGSTDTQTWRYPSNSDCVSCHNATSGGTLGARTRYLNKDYTYPKTGRTANQLVTLSHLGILDEVINDSDTNNFLTYKSIDDPNASVDEKARSYMDLNCAYCHRPGTGVRGDFDLRMKLDIAQTGLLTATPYESLGIPDEKIVDPGNINTSILYHRVNSVDPAIQMPPIAKNEIDDNAVQLIADWITQLSNPCPDRIIMEKYSNVSGTSIAELKSNSNYPNNPSQVDELIEFTIPINVDDQYGVRVKGILKAPETGTYYFWISGDDNVELNLSSDATEANKNRVAYHNGWSNFNEWNKYSTQKSGGINLVAGQNYYLEALMNEAGGGDNLSVGWRKPSNGNGTVPSEIIPCTVFDYFNGPPVVNVTGVNVNPVATTVIAGATEQLTATVTPADADDPSVTWSSDDETVATVDANGLVSGVAEGTATITATSNADNSIMGTSEVTVETAPVPVTGVGVDPDPATVAVGATEQLTATVTPADADDPSVTWSSDDETVATVDANGLVSGVAEGTATITATSNADNSIMGTSEVRVETAPVPVTGVGVDPDPATVAVGATEQLTATVTPADADDPSVTWSSHNETVATVDANGLVSGVAEGTATITATSNADNSIMGTSEVTVETAPVPVTGVGVDPDPATVAVGATEQLTATVTPADADDPSVTWSSDDETVATVDATGLVSGVAEGTATITATSNADNSIMGTSEVTVETAPVPVTGVSVDPDPATVAVGATEQLTATVTPADADDPSVTWSSDDEIVATVDATGLVSGVAEGTATITATSNADNSIMGTSEVTVGPAPVPVTGVGVDPDPATVAVGATEQLTATVTPADADDPSVTWSSDDETVATVDANGLVSGVAEGTATITATSNADNSIMGTSEVRVETAPVPVTGVGVDPDPATVAVGATEQLTATVTPADADDPSVTWSSHNETVATVDANGLVSGVAEGTATITATSNADNSIMGTSEVTVETAPVPVTGVGVDPDPATVAVGATEQLTATVTPADADDPSVTWSSDDETVATVDATGLVSGVAEGTATITATSNADNSIMGTSEVTVETAPVPVTGVSVAPDTATIAEGDTQLFTATVLPMDADDRTVSWSSDNTAIASVDTNGLVTGIMTGTATITVTTNDGNYTSTASIIIDGGGCVLSNVALGGTASQSSTYGKGLASVAVDGNTTGTSPWTPDIQHTANEGTPWWQVDLGADHSVSEIRIFNRGDSFSSRLNNFYVFISGSPFPPGVTLSELTGDSSLYSYYFAGAAGLQETIATDTEGRYVRVQLSGNGILNMAEVEVLGCFLGTSPCDGEPPVTIAPSGPYMDTDPVQALSGSPTGGTWSGASTDGSFDPGIGAGTYSVTYTYDNGSGCVRSETADIVVNTTGSGGCVLSNVALGGTASQSSTYGKGLASVAVDGNTTGTSPWTPDIQHTANENTPWWQVDLGADHSIDDIRIFNRGDGFSSRLSDFHVFVSASPFPAQATLSELTADGGIAKYHFTGTAGAQETLAFDTEGRYVRVQLSGNGILHMAEVEVLGCFLGASPCDGEPPVTIAPSGPYLDTDPVQALSGSPTGGTWSGASTDGSFDPGIGAGTYSVTYTYDNGSGCVRSETADIVVNTTGSGGCVLSNVALGGTASQSSTYGKGLASVAVDGNTTGTSPWTPDIQHTANENTPWWQVDLGADHSIDDIRIFNRGDGFSSRLSDFHVFVSASPFPAQATLSELTADGGIADYHFTGTAGAQETLAFDTEGRYVRVQLSGNGILHMAEVEVLGCPIEDESQSSTSSKEFFNTKSNTIEASKVIFDIDLVPNPVLEHVELRAIGEGGAIGLAVYDGNGRLVLQREFGTPLSAGNPRTLEVSRLAKGVYQLYFTLSDGSSFVEKLVKE